MAQINLNNNNKIDDERKQKQDNISITEEEEEEVIEDPDTLDIDEDLTLQYRWALWYSAPKSKDKEKKWDTERVRKVVEIGNVKEFWRYYLFICLLNKYLMNKQT